MTIDGLYHSGLKPSSYMYHLGANDTTGITVVEVTPANQGSNRQWPIIEDVVCKWPGTQAVPHELGAMVNL
jgi:hypothetical protein